MRRYTIRRAKGPVTLTGRVAGTAWADAAAMAIDRYPWYAAGRKQPTAVRMLYDSRALVVQFRCRDRHFSAETAELNGPVYLDSCVELFAQPRPAERADYFNLEINCCACIHLGWGPQRHGRRLATPEVAGRILVAASVLTATKAEAPYDRRWWVAAAIPFDALSDLAGMLIPVHPGVVWRANLYRCGGRTDPQYAVWNPIAAPQPDYHRPECFGELRFA